MFNPLSCPTIEFSNAECKKQKFDVIEEYRKIRKRILNGHTGMDGRYSEYDEQFLGDILQNIVER